jgi:hypothetical protein
MFGQNTPKGRLANMLLEIYNMAGSPKEQPRAKKIK